MTVSLPALTLVLGAAASGKSAFAERLLAATGRPMTYIATAQAFDEEMRLKIAAHRARRGSGWSTVEAPLDLTAPLAAVEPQGAVLIDCATLWLTNHLMAEHDLITEESRLLHAIRDAAAPVVVVSNEVGAGIVPENALARRFRAAQGRLNQSLAARADLVVAVMAGLPLVLKGHLPEGLA
jgi:adenosylcobinamide kinase / adenosylcobinamide-phosphate guanylyltransferase